MNSLGGKMIHLIQGSRLTIKMLPDQRAESNPCSKINLKHFHEFISQSFSTDPPICQSPQNSHIPAQ